MWRFLFMATVVGLPGLVSLADGQSRPAVAFEIVDGITGQAIADANVTILSLHNLEHPVSVKTNLDGRARYIESSEQDARRLRVTVRASGHHPFHAAIDNAKTSSNPYQIRMRPGKVLRGRVSDSSGQPIAGVRVTTTDAADVSLHGYYYTLFDTKTDVEGRFGFDSVASRKILRLQFSHPNYRTQWVSGLDDGEMEVVFTKKRRVRGTVTNFRGAPVANAIVVAEHGGNQTTTSADGMFDLGMVSGTPIQIVVTADRLSPQLVSVSADMNASKLPVRLLPGRTIRFRVTGKEGQPVSSVQVNSSIWKNTSALRLEETSDDNGYVTIRNAPADVVEYKFRHPEYAIHIKRLKAESKRHEIELLDAHPSKLPDADQTALPVAEFLTNKPMALDLDPSVPTRRIMHLCKIDGTVLKPLINDVGLRHKYDRHGTPDVSADGSTIAYDAWSTDGGDWDDARIIVANIDGTNARDIVWGVIPSLSPDGSHVAYSRPTKFAPKGAARGQSIWTMKTDGSDQKLIADNYAWGARWTADGKSIVFRGGLDDRGTTVSGNCLRVYDLQTETTRNVFSPEESPFTSLKFHLNVSRHGRLAVMKGTLREGGGAIAVVNIDRGVESIRLVKRHFPEDPNFFVPVGGVASISHDENWIAIACRNKGGMVGHAIDIDGILEPHSFPNFPKDCLVLDPTYTPDGKHIIVGISP